MAKGTGQAKASKTDEKQNKNSRKPTQPAAKKVDSAKTSSKHKQIESVTTFQRTRTSKAVPAIAIVTASKKVSNMLCSVKDFDYAGRRIPGLVDPATIRGELGIRKDGGRPYVPMLLGLPRIRQPNMVLYSVYVVIKSQPAQKHVATHEQCVFPPNVPAKEMLSIIYKRGIQYLKNIDLPAGVTQNMTPYLKAALFRLLSGDKANKLNDLKMVCDHDMVKVLKQAALVCAENNWDPKKLYDFLQSLGSTVSFETVTKHVQKRKESLKATQKLNQQKPVADQVKKKKKPTPDKVGTSPSTSKPPAPSSGESKKKKKQKPNVNVEVSLPTVNDKPQQSNVTKGSPLLGEKENGKKRVPKTESHDTPAAKNTLASKAQDSKEKADVPTSVKTERGKKPPQQPGTPPDGKGVDVKRSGTSEALGPKDTKKKPVTAVNTKNDARLGVH